MVKILKWGLLVILLLSIFAIETLESYKYSGFFKHHTKLSATSISLLLYFTNIYLAIKFKALKNFRYILLILISSNLALITWVNSQNLQLVSSSNNEEILYLKYHIDSNALKKFSNLQWMLFYATLTYFYQEILIYLQLILKTVVWLVAKSISLNKQLRSNKSRKFFKRIFFFWPETFLMTAVFVAYLILSKSTPQPFMTNLLLAYSITGVFISNRTPNVASLLGVSLIYLLVATTALITPDLSKGLVIYMIAVTYTATTALYLVLLSPKRTSDNSFIQINN